jgi:hypothetical protein
MVSAIGQAIGATDWIDFRLFDKLFSARIWVGCGCESVGDWVVTQLDWSFFLLFHD